MSNQDPLSPSEDQLLATLRAATQHGGPAARAEMASGDEPSLQEAYAGFAKAMGALAQPVDVQGVVESILGRTNHAGEQVGADDSPAPAKPAEEVPSVPRRRRRFWANPWSYAAMASIVVVAGLTWIENVSTDRAKKVEASELTQWHGYARIDEKLDRSTLELELVQQVPDFVFDARPLDMRLEDAEADMNALLNDMGLVPL